LTGILLANLQFSRMAERPKDIIYALDERPPAPQLLALGFQLPARCAARTALSLLRIRFWKSGLKQCLQLLPGFSVGFGVISDINAELLSTFICGGIAEAVLRAGI
jgi:hypothetical protein